MKTHIESTLRSLNGMQNSQIPGGFESDLASQLVHEEDEDQVFFKSIKFKFDMAGCATMNVADVRAKTLVALSNFLVNRFEIDKRLLEKITPFINFDPTANVEDIHSLLAADVSLPDLYTQYNDFTDGKHTMNAMNLKQ